MKKPLIVYVVVAAGLVLTAACQQSPKGKSSSKWHLTPAPSTAAGYGAAPLASDYPEPPGASPAAVSPGYSSKATPEDTGGATEKPPAAGGYGPPAASTGWKIEPPPSAAGYGK